MTYVKWQPAHLPALINSIFNDTFSKEFDSVLNVPVLRNLPMTNVVETPTAYNIDVAAPGFTKESFSLNIEKSVLTIEGKQESTTENKGETPSKHLRHEYHLNSFKRQYTLPEDADDSQIKAEYVNGILKIALPKKAKAQEPAAKTITVQ